MPISPGEAVARRLSVAANVGTSQTAAAIEVLVVLRVVITTEAGDLATVLKRRPFPPVSS
jgi:hypothetical protein